MSVFRFKEFEIFQANAALKVGTDAMIFGAFLNAEGKKSALDIGAGTGVLSLMAAQRNKDLKIEAIEIEEAAIGDCLLNFENSNWSKNLKLHNGDFLQFQFKKKFDIIFTNPPFYYNGLLSDSNAANLAKHNNALPFEKLFEKVAKLLSSCGDFWIIIPFELESFILSLASSVGLMEFQRINVCAKPGRTSRLIFCFSNTVKSYKEESFIIRDASGKYTQEYKVLTQDFHGITIQ